MSLTPDEQRGYADGTLAYPRCYRCGHNFFDTGLRPTVAGKPIDFGPCRWCVDELRDDREELRVALATVLDQVDYTQGACSPTEMVAAVLPQPVLEFARAALAAAADKEQL
jgi:hypothetical protein